MTRAIWTASVGGEPPTAQADWVGRVGGGRLLASHSLARRPLFALASGEAYSTRDVRLLVQRVAAVCGEPPEEFGAMSLRAGGATDLRVYVGDSSLELIKQRGRWCSEIGRIYQRALLRTQLDGSGAMGDSAGADMEAVCVGWSQPATF